MNRWSHATADPLATSNDRQNVAPEAQGSYLNNTPQSKLRKPEGTAITLAIATLVLVFTLTSLSALTQTFGIISLLVSLLVWATMASIIWHFSGHHDRTTFGHANATTTARAISTAVLAGLIPVAAYLSSNTWLWSIATAATITLCLDGLDGYLARKNKSCSVFGARFDMEIDAFLALVITLFLWQSERLGAWVLLLGLMRYVFISASYWFTYLRADLYPSMRRKTVCVIQVGALCLMLCPLLEPIQASYIGLIALGFLTYSFASDVWWLFRRHRTISKR